MHVLIHMMINDIDKQLQFSLVKNINNCFKKKKKLKSGCTEIWILKIIIFNSYRHLHMHN